MKITKFGHCCLLIVENGVRILTDPGSYTIEAQEQLKNIDLILFTHEHVDHFHAESLKKILTNNPNATIVTNSTVGKLLDKEGIKYQVVGDGQKTEFKGLAIEGFGTKHAIIYEDYGQVENTGYFVANKLFYPGDAFTDPGKPMEILALPAGGPWMKASEAIDYGKKLKPKKAFPVHDAMFLPGSNFSLMLIQNFLAKDKIEFTIIELNKETEF
jgi:L-ascorbate metabolism protein UlaG (beta-lactamase superfamily)